MRCLSLHFDSVQALPNAAEAASLAGSVNLDHANHPGVSYTNTRVFHIKTPWCFTHKHPVFHIKTPGCFTYKHPGISLSNTRVFGCLHLT